MEYSFNYRLLSLNYGYKINMCLRDRDRQTETENMCLKG